MSALLLLPLGMPGCVFLGAQGAATAPPHFVVEHEQNGSDDAKNSKHGDLQKFRAPHIASLKADFNG